jgi:P-type conjugative transfer protein TrbG
VSLAHPWLFRATVLLSSTLVSQTLRAEDLEQQFLGGRQLTPQDDEARALEALATSRPRGRPSDTPVIHADSSIQFTFGATRPVVICAPLQVCDIELQPGERVRSVQVGDAVRWTVEPAVTGVAPVEVQHVIIKPADVGLRTSLVVATDRRTYRLKLVSHRSEYMASVSFAYPSDAGTKWAELAEHPARAARSRTDKSPRPRRQRAGGSLRALSFNYEIEGDDPPWKPVRVYNDGLQTVIEMPFAMRQTEAPTLLVVRAEGGLFTKDDVVQVNFHTQGTRYLVDMVFDVADLVVGVGSSQQRVRIRRK